MIISFFLVTFMCDFGGIFSAYKSKDLGRANGYSPHSRFNCEITLVLPLRYLCTRN